MTRAIETSVPPVDNDAYGFGLAAILMEWRLENVELVF
jgi:hypothetical protein